MKPRQRPGASDGVLVIALFALLLVDAQFCPEGKGISIVGTLAAGVGTVPLLWRRQAPLVALTLVVVAVFLILPTLKPVNAIVLAPLLGLYSVARYGNRRRSLLIAALSAPIPGLAMLVNSDKSLLSLDLLQTVAMLLLAVAVGEVVRTKLEYHERSERERAAESERRIAEERVRIARDVHDVVAHAMVAINVQAGVAAHLLDRRPDQAETALHEIKRVSGEALADLRSTLGVLREGEVEAPVHPTNSLGEVAELAGPLRAAGLAVDVRVEGVHDAVPSTVGAAAYRIVQEALTNVLRHAGAQRADVRVAVGSDAVELEVVDDGPATAVVPGSPPGSGNGLRGMAERASAVGGALHAGRVDGGGWRVHASLPLR